VVDQNLRVEILAELLDALLLHEGDIPGLHGPFLLNHLFVYVEQHKGKAWFIIIGKGRHENVVGKHQIHDHFYRNLR
jgi:hypothetical protein